MPTTPKDRPAANIVTLDQEKRGLVAVLDGADAVPFDTTLDLDLLPVGGGLVIADANVWSVNTGKSQSQYCWPTSESRETFLAALAERGYTAVLVPNVLANRLYLAYGFKQADAVSALYAYAHDQVRRPVRDGEPQASCGCTHHGTFDSGHPVRESAGDNSYGVRAEATDAFLFLQNSGGYESPFAEAVTRLAWENLDRAGRDLFSIQVRTPTCKAPARLMAVAACTHDPLTGQLRTHQGRPLGKQFITRRVIGLNGMMRGTGEGAPGNPMRAVLRIRGIRSVGRKHAVDKEARAELDRYVGQLITLLQRHGDLPAAV